MQQQQISQIEKKLHGEQQRLEELLERTSKHLYRRDEPYSADFAEQVVEVENNQVVEALDHEAKTELINIKQALGRIKEGVFGVCTQCSEEISAARLEAIPQAGLCINCAEKS